MASLSKPEPTSIDMNRQQWEKITGLYDKARQLEPDLRAAFLRDACGRDELLRREVESLLEHDRQAGSFLSAPALERVTGPLATEGPADESPLGQDGMEFSESMSSRRPPWWMFLVAASFLALVMFIPYLFFRGPNLEASMFEGGLVAAFESGAMKLQAVPPSSPFGQAGLQAGDRLLAVSRHPVRSMRDWQTVLANMEPGKRQPWNIARGEQLLEVGVAVERSAWKNPLTHNPWLPFIFGCYILGCLIGFRRPYDPVARMGAWFIITASLPFGLGTGWAAVWRQLPVIVQLFLWIPQISRFVIEGIFLSFFVIFPRRLFHKRWPWLVIWIPVLATLPWRIYGLDSVIHWRLDAGVPAWLDRISLVRTMVYLMAGLAVLVVSYRQLDTVNERRRVRVLMMGTAISLMAAGAGVWYYSFRQGLGAWDTVYGYLLSSTFLACPLAFYYAIFRHRVFDIRLIIRQGLQYALARGAVLGVIPFLGAILILDLAINSEQRLVDILRSHGSIYSALGSLAVLVYFKRKPWLEALDRRFFRERYNAQRVLREVVEEIRESKSFDRVLPKVVARIESALHAEFVSVMVREPGASEYRAIASVPSGQAPPPLAADSKLASLLRLLEKPLENLTVDTVWLKTLPRQEIAFLRRSRIDLLVSISAIPGRNEALLALGIKRSEEPYTREDRELLQAITASLALLLESPAVVEQHRTMTFQECPKCGLCYESTAVGCTQDSGQLVQIRLPRTLAGRYRLERRRGGGGMGTVYEATDQALERRVAVKLIRDDWVDSLEAAERFRREARTAAGFSHPNVVTVYDYGVEAGTRAFLVMELLDGCSLREELERSKRLDAARTIQIFRGVCTAVEAAHRRQLIHRDLKPENIFLSKSGDAGAVVKVLDFGIAKFLGTNDDSTPTRSIVETRTGILIGTPAYMSPEQLLGEKLDLSWDLWALAVTAYETLAGTLPFVAVPGMDWRRAILDRNLPPLSGGLMNSATRLQAFFTKCFATDRKSRPQSGAEFLEGFEQALAPYDNT